MTMNTKDMILKLMVLTVLMAVAVAGIFSAPVAEVSPDAWLATLVVSKAIGLGAGWALIRLTRRWMAGYADGFR